MMTRNEAKQSKLLLVTMEELIPQDHFLRKLDAAISFDFVYDLVSPLYSDRGRPSIDPVLLVKMLLLGYLYGIDSERKLEEEVRYNIAYRWYLGLDLDDPVPDHSTFSQNRRRRFHGQDIFRQIFERIVQECQDVGLVRGENVVMDSTHIKANADNHNSVWIDVVKKPQAYWDDLNVADLPVEVSTKSKNPCDADAGYMNRTNKPKGFHYLSHQCSDADTGIILDVSVTGGDIQDCECCVERFEYLKNDRNYPVKAAGLDSGYDTIAIHYGLTRLGISAFIHPCKRGIRRESKRVSIEQFTWDPTHNCYICPNQCKLNYRETWSRKGVPLKNYVAVQSNCRQCPYRENCITDKSKVRKITRRPGQEFQEAGRKRKGTYAYQSILKRRQIVCEGNFALQKRCHNLRFTRKRGIENVLEQCLLSASALNLKRLIKGTDIHKIPDGKSIKALAPSGISSILGLRLYILSAVSKPCRKSGCLSTDPDCRRRFSASPVSPSSALLPPAGGIWGLGPAPASAFVIRKLCLRQ